MELRSEEKQEKENKGKKIIIIAIVIMIALIIITSVAIVLLQQKENEKTKLQVNGQLTSIPYDFMVTDEETGETYYSVKRMAYLAGYEYYNGEYKKYSEDKTKCYVECENEIAMFQSGSYSITKSNSKEKTNFSDFSIKRPIKTYNESLYLNGDAAQVAFNMQIGYNKNNHTIIMNTLPRLVEIYKNNVKSYGYTDLCEDFATQKAIINNLLVVEKDKKFGVISADSYSSVIGNKYDSIEYIESTGEFIATSDGKSGILSKDGQVKIGLRYDEIGLIDGKNEIYYAKNSDLYGILNGNGKVLVYIQYDEIGIDRDQFPLADVKNDLFLFDNCIPLKKDGKWGLSDKTGNMILDVEYDQLGYVKKTTQVVNENNKQNVIEGTPNSGEKSINNVIVIPSIDGIVIGKNEKYGVVNKIGKIIIPCEFDKIYSITNEGKDEVYIEKDNRSMKLDKYLEENRIDVETDTNNIDNMYQNYITNNTTDDNMPSIDIIDPNEKNFVFVI